MINHRHHIKNDEKYDKIKHERTYLIHKPMKLNELLRIIKNNINLMRY